ncbi:MAG: transglutaminase-like domain-containing protein [Ruminococcus sp.]|nr:transglutaminase-like domain-containing protein [Ruminococcus sp.]
MQKNNRFKNFLLKIACDSVLIYTVIIMMAIMYHYKSEHTIIYGVVSYVITGISFRLFDYMTKHKFTGTLGYIALFLIFIYTARFVQVKGEQSYPLSFGIWFLTPQDVLDYSKWYTIEIFLLFQLFMMSVIYYFTRVRYRIFMGFLIMIIPFAIYGKEYEKMPTYFIIMLAVSYIIIMTDFRQLQNTDKIEVIGKKEIWRSVATYAVIFAVVSAIIPKPTIEENRDFLDTLISADQFTDRLISMLGVFRETTDNEQFFSGNNTPVYYVSSQDPMRFKLTTFSTYNYDNDSWTVEDTDKNYSTTFRLHTDTMKNGLYHFDETGSLTEAILYTAGKSTEFAEKYNLDGFTPEQFSIPERRWISIMSNIRGSQFAPLPQLVQDFWSTTYMEEMSLTESGTIRATGETGQNFARDEKFVYSYTPENFFTDSTNIKIIDSMSVENYTEMLTDAIALQDNEYAGTISKGLAEYVSYSDYLLDYGDSQKIYELAQQITTGCESDYDKANAIEAYFRDNGYIYDLNYRKGKGENAEDFLFTSKRGVCYEYATAMVLLARAVGIPARYCEGYNMSRLYNNNILKTNFIVTSNDAHGFPELYIKGFGWVSFEPTVSDTEELQQNTTASDALTRAGIIILVTALLVIMAVMFYPIVSHRIFMYVYGKKPPEEVVLAVMHRISRLSGTDTGYTVQEIAEVVLNKYGTDIHDTARLFDMTVYGGIALSDTDRVTAMTSYVSVYEAIREQKHNKKIKK